MRHLIAILIMVIVPFQSAWSVAMNLHGHMGADAAGGIMHVHDHENQLHEEHSISQTCTMDQDHGHNEDGHHDPHCHPVFNPIVTETTQALEVARTNEPILQAPSDFFSHTPPLFDRPPLARA